MTASNMVEIPKELLARLMAAIENYEELTDKEIAELLEDANEWVDEDDN